MGEYNGPDPGYTPMAMSKGSGGIVIPDPSATKVMFYTKPKLMPALSKEQGRQVWQNIEYVRVHQPGEKHPIELEAHDGHRQRWAREYEAFQAGKQAIPEGTPLSILLPGNEAGINELNSLSIFTIEQMAAIPDSVLHRIPFGTGMKVRAQRYISAMQGAQGFNKVQSELDKANTKAAEMERRMEEMQAQMASLSQPQAPAVDPTVAALIAQLNAQNQPKPRRGRPPKEQNVEAA